MTRAPMHALAHALALALAGCYEGAADPQDGSGTDGDSDSGEEGGSDAGDEGPGGDPEAYYGLSMRILTATQYENAVGDLLGSASRDAVEPPPDIAVLGFDGVGAAQFAIASDAVRAYEASARAAASEAIADAGFLGTWVPCDAGAPSDDACMQQFVPTFGRRAWRRPLTDDELATWVAIGLAGVDATGRIDGGVEAVVSGMLQSPHFVYMVEVGEPDPDDPDRLRLDGYEIATRLAFFLAGTAPDDALLDAAEAGELDGADGIRTHARDLLARPSARGAVRTFFDELFRLRDLPAVTKDTARFPEFSAELAAAMRQESLLFLEDAAFSSADFRGIFDAEHTYVDAQLAALYGLPDPGSDDLVRVALPTDGPRAGVLGHAGLLTLLSHPNSTSPTLRGKFIRERILCETVAAPPPDVDTSLPEDDPDAPQTMKERLLEHRENPQCAGCHVAMDDLGLGLEQFDGIGRFRETDEGLAIDASSTFDGEPFAGVRELGALLREDPRTASCLTRNFLRVATGHVESPDQEALLAAVDEAFADADFDLIELLVAIATSHAFRYAEPPGDAP